MPPSTSIDVAGSLEPLRLVEVEDTRNSRPEKKISGTLCHNRWRREDKHA